MSARALPSPDAEMIAQEFQDFAYTVSHDLNAPLRAIVQFSHLLLEEEGENVRDGR
jgi:light-regulated signal transduction histidine kinase (bacteriophytochrome)